MEDNRTFATIFALLQNGKRRRFEEEFTKFRKLQLKGGVKSKIELCKLIELVLVTDGRFSSLLITDLYNLLTDRSKNVGLKALDTISLCIDTLIFNVVECHTHRDAVSDKLYIPGGTELFKNVLADYECLRSSYLSLLKSTKSNEVIFLIYKILASELQAFAEVDVSDYILYDNKNYFNTHLVSNIEHKKSRNPTYPDCSCTCKFLSKNSSTISYGELKPLRFSKCTRNSEMKNYFERWRDENIQILIKYLTVNKKPNFENINFLMSLHVSSMAISCYPLTYNNLLNNIQEILKPLIINNKSSDAIDGYIYKQFIRIISSKVSVSLHKEIYEFLFQLGFVSSLDIIYREINCIGSVIMECKAPFDPDRVYIMSCSFEDFGGLCSIPMENCTNGNLLEKRGPIYYITNPERVELIGHLAVSKPLPKLIDIALGYDVSKDSQGRSRSDVSQFADIPACKVLYFAPEMLKFDVTTTVNMEISDAFQFKNMKDNLLNESSNDIDTKIASTNEINNDFNFLSKMVANQILKADSVKHGKYLDKIKRNLMNKILLDNYLEPQVSREMLTMYINNFIVKLEMNRYIKSNPDAATIQNALNEWNDYFDSVTDLLYHKCILNYINPRMVKREDLQKNIDCNENIKVDYNELLLLCFNGFYSEKILVNRSFRDIYIKSICSFILSIPCITDGLIDRFNTLLDNIGGSLLVFSLVSNLLKKSKSINSKQKMFSLFLKSLYHKSPSVRNLFYKLIESPKGLYITFDNQSCKYSNKEFEKLHCYLYLLVSNKYGDVCNKCKSGGLICNIPNLDSALSSPIWQWPMEIINILVDWSKSLETFQFIEIQTINCNKCNRNVFTLDNDKILYNVLYMWDNAKEDADLCWNNPQYLHNIWLQETIFYIFIRGRINYNDIASNDVASNDTSLNGNTNLNVTSLNDTNLSKLSRFLVPNSYLRNLCDEIIEYNEISSTDSPFYAVSAICNRSPNLLSPLLHIIDSFSVNYTQCSGRLCNNINQTIIDIISNTSSLHINHFYLILQNYLSSTPESCLIGHVLNNIAVKWSEPNYNIVEKLFPMSNNTPEAQIILLCMDKFKSVKIVMAIIPMIGFLPKNIAIELIDYLFVNGNENSIKNCIENVLSIPSEIRDNMNSKLANFSQQWLLPEELLITIYKFNSVNVDRKKQAILLDYIISLVETNQKRPNVSKNIIMSLHSIVKSCTMIVEDEEPISFIFGRLLCQVVQNVPSVRGGVVQHVMPALITRKAWEDKQLWKGVVISFGILWPEFREPLTLLIFQLPQAVGEDLLQGVQQRHSVIPDMAAIVSKKQHLKSICPKYISSILGV